MGIEDRDRWQKDHNTDQAHNTSSDLKTISEHHGHGNRALPRSLKFGHLGIILFWSVIMAALYFTMKLVIEPKAPTITASGDLRLNRARDGHFYAPGLVNGKPVIFLIDTGASMVVVSQTFAEDAGLTGGVATTFSTANGRLPGRIVHNVPVSVGSITVSGLSVGVGLNLAQRNQALLGQSFLSKFNLSLGKDELILHKR